MPTVSRPVRRGQIWWVDWSPGRGSEQFGRRPALIIQADEGNGADFPNTIILALTSSGPENQLRVRIEPSKLNNLSKVGYVKCDQILTIAKARLDGFIGVAEPNVMVQVEKALLLVLALPPH